MVHFYNVAGSLAIINLDAYTSSIRNNPDFWIIKLFCCDLIMIIEFGLRLRLYFYFWLKKQNQMTTEIESLVLQ